MIVTLKNNVCTVFAVFCCVILSFTAHADLPSHMIAVEDLRDKIAGGWAGKMIGVIYGEPTEHRALAETYEAELTWDPQDIKRALRQDDIYVQLSFMETMDRHGIDAPADKFAEALVDAGYQLWHANFQCRKNYLDGLRPPLTGHPDYNIHADDIDFQIDADFIGFITPGLPRTANKIADKIGHILCYGDGVYGGMFVANLYASAFIQNDLRSIIDNALRSIPAESEYAACIRDVIALHDKYPSNWRGAWKELEDKWGDVDICGALNPYNIDAKLNGAYIVMGLLYGDSDFEKTMEISIRCGRDSDCNPSNAAAVIGVLHGYEAIPDKWKQGIPAIADSMISYTGYSFNTAVDRTLHYALSLVRTNGGSIVDRSITIPVQEPVAPALEVSFPHVVPFYTSSAFDIRQWTFTGDWHTRYSEKTAYPCFPARYTDAAGDSMTFTFVGAGIALKGAYGKNGGKADIYIDGSLHRVIDTYYWWGLEEKNDYVIWHAMNLQHGKHTVTLVARGDSNSESAGSRIAVRGAIVYRTGKKKNEMAAF